MPLPSDVSGCPRTPFLGRVSLLATVPGAFVESRCGAVGLGLPSGCWLFRLPVPQYQTLLPFPHPAQRTGRAQLRHPALGQRLLCQDVLTRSHSESSVALG
jgi:hypothetical protein